MPYGHLYQPGIIKTIIKGEWPQNEKKEIENKSLSQTK